jgi:hypothetical protein
MRALVNVLVAAAALAGAARATVGVARTPPMGYNTWNYWHCGVNASVLMAAADAFVERGLAAAGYEYVNRYVIRRSVFGDIPPRTMRMCVVGWLAAIPHFRKPSVLSGTEAGIA